MSVRHPLAAPAILLLVLLALLLFGAQQDAGVADEHPHILSGALYWQSGVFAGGFDNPPLGQLWITAPLQLFHIDYRFPDDTQLLWARLPVIVLTLLLAAILSLWAYALSGAAAAAIVVGLFCLEPNLLAHGHLATLDVPLACAWWVTLWLLRQWLHGNSGAAVGICLALAIAVLVKFTALLLLPVVFLVGVLHEHSWRRLGQMTLLCSSALLLTWGLAWLVYGFDGQRFGWPSGLVAAIAGKVQHRNEGHFAYLAGRRSMHGFAEYNLLVLAWKTPLPLLVLSSAGIVACWRSWQRHDRLLLLVPSIALLVVSSLGGVHIGVRHLLPIQAGLLLCASVGLLAGYRASGWRRAATTLLLVWWIASVARISPQWIPYFNELAGGPANGDQWLVDSNLDWGQDDTRLATFLRQEAAQGRPYSVNPPAHQPRTGRIVVNANELHALLRMQDQRYAWLRRHLSTGRVGWSWKTWELSVDDYARAWRDHPQDEERLLDYGRILLTQKRAPEALSLLQSHASALSARGWQVAVEIALDAELYAAAEEWRQRVPAGLRSQERWQPLLLRMQLQQQLREAREPAHSELELGLYWAQMHDLQRAGPLLRSAARTLPQDIDSQRAYVMWLAQKGRYDEAAALASQPLLVASLREEAVVLSAVAQTLQQLLQALEVGGSVDQQALRELAQSEFEAERVDRAAAALVQLLRQDPADRDALHLLGEMQVRSKLRVVAERITPRSLRALLSTTSDGSAAP